MKRWITVLVVGAAMVAAALGMGSKNFAQCAVDGISRGTENDVIARSVAKSCMDKYGFSNIQEALASVPQGDGRGVFAFESGAACVAKRGRHVRSEWGARLLRAACSKLYDESRVYDPFGP